MLTLKQLKNRIIETTKEIYYASSIKRYKAFVGYSADDCYNPYTNDCDIRCQGCSDCPIAQTSKASPFKVRRHFVRCKIGNDWMQEFFDSEDFKNIIKDLREQRNR